MRAFTCLLQSNSSQSIHRTSTNQWVHCLTVTCRITTADLLELRAANVRAIRVAREPAMEQGLADSRGYDLIEIPEVRVVPYAIQGLQHSNRGVQAASK